MSIDQMPESEAASSPGAESPASPGSQNTATGTTKKRKSKTSKPRLTAMQKNTNHKDAENKRRTAIRERFTELSQLVPEAAGQERSEQVMLQKTKDYLENSMRELRELEALAAQQGIQIPQDMKLKDTDYGGSKWKQPNLAKYEKSKLKKSYKTGAQEDDDIDGEAEDE